MTRVRFAPSPTGYLHVGNARTALFNWLYARHYDGTFILRIEDTDKERSTEASIEEIVKSLRWLGLDWDEYYRQTERTEEHAKAAQDLMDRSLAYEFEGAWWFRVPTEGETIVHDDLLGDVAFSNDQLKDFVIRRSDGSFIYHFVVVVDDADMGVTHVIRGDDHLNNAPKHVLLFEALGREVPRFVHLPMILGPDRTRLSKRHGVTAVLGYRERGLLPETMVNFLARLGWAHGDDEVFDRDTLVELFSIDEVNKSGAIFEDAKLLWLNQQHLKRADLSRLLDLVKPFILGLGRVSAEAWDTHDVATLKKGAHLLRDRCKTLEDLALAMELLFPVPLQPVDPVEVTSDQAPLMLGVADALAQCEDFEPECIEQTFRDSLAAQGAKLKDIALASRLATTGRRAGPSLFEILSPIGCENVVGRMRKAAKEALADEA